MRNVVLAIVMVFLGTWAAAEDKPVNIRPEIGSVTVETTAGPVEIMREQDNLNELFGDWVLTSRPCPPFCIQPMVVAEGVTTIGELELLEMLKDPEARVIDSRLIDQFRAGSIPGAISMPYNEIIDRLAELGCEADFDGWRCEDAIRVALFCNGNWCGQSPTAIRNLLESGYPADRIYYYRGGMQAWRLLGLTVVGQ